MPAQRIRVPLRARYIALAIQGRLQPARTLLDGLDDASARVDHRTERELAARFRQRFIEGSEAPSPGTGNTLVDEVVSAYRMYWRQALLADSPQAGDERPLEHAVAAALRQDGPAGEAPPWETLFTALGPAIERQGYHDGLGGGRDLVLCRVGFCAEPGVAAR